MSVLMVVLNHTGRSLWNNVLPILTWHLLPCHCG